MKYPIDHTTTQEFFGYLVAHEKAQREVISFLTSLLQDAMDVAEDEDADWFTEANSYLQMQQNLKMEHENRIFDEDNLRKARGMQPKTIPATLDHRVARAIAPIEFDAATNNEFNKVEAKFGEEWSETDLARHFAEPSSSKKKKKEREVNLSKKNPFKGMSNEEIVEWEAKQNNSNDIYKIKARVANLAREGGAALTPVGEMLCNTFVHVAKDMYDFAESIDDPNVKIGLIELIRKHENMPANLIAATTAGVNVKKK